MNASKNHKNLCRQCAVCCHLMPRIELSGIKFIPVAQKIEGMAEQDRGFLSMFVCEHLDTKTHSCKIYNKRPLACRKSFCKGKPAPQFIDIKGEMISGVQDQQNAGNVHGEGRSEAAGGCITGSTKPHS